MRANLSPRHLKARLGMRPFLVARPLLVALALTLTAAFVAACGPSSVRLPAPSPTPSPSPTPTLAPLVAQPGWTIAGRLGFVSEGVTTSGTNFVAQQPYQVVITCEGSGSLAVTLASPAVSTQVVMCTPAPQTQRFEDLSPPAEQHVQVSVAAAQGVTWIGALEFKQ